MTVTTLADEALDIAVAYAKERRSMGKPIIDVWEQPVWLRPGESKTQDDITIKYLKLVTHGEPPTNVRLPVLLFTANYYLTDVDDPKYGATEVVPRSHLFGRGCLLARRLVEAGVAMTTASIPGSSRIRRTT